MKYMIELKGCDGTTEFEVELTRNEADVVDKISALSQETSQYGCEPTLFIQEAK